MTVYLDTQIVVWLCQGQTEKIPQKATTAIEASDLEISPMVLLELEYLYEIKRLTKPPLALLDQLRSLIGLRISEHPFQAVAHTALFETWTRNPFDRLIVAQARSDSYAPLITSDHDIHQNYSKSLWT